MESIWTKIKEELKKTIKDEREYNLWISPIKFIGTDENELYLKVPDSNFFSFIEGKYIDLINSLLISYDPNLKIRFIYPEAKKGKRKKVSSTKYPNINENYTFDNFIPGEGSKFAFAVAYSVAKGESNYNPVYIYGDVGLGKTHLLTAIANYILKNDKSKNVMFKSSKDFMDEMVYHLQNKKYTEFKNKYKNADILIIDDIQLMSTWEATKKELFFIFNELYEANKQIIISSDCPPKDLKKLEERLRSRFEWGIIAQIEPPDLENRIAILMEKAREKNIPITKDIAEYIASKIKRNVRTLEGALSRIGAIASIRGIPITIGLVREEIKDYVDENKEEVTPERIKNFIAEKYGVKVNELSSKNNSPRVSFPRQIAMYLLKVIIDMPLNKIGKEFGNKHHSTVLHSINKIQSKMESDSAFEKEIESYIRRFKDI